MREKPYGFWVRMHQNDKKKNNELYFEYMGI